MAAVEVQRNSGFPSLGVGTSPVEAVHHQMGPSSMASQPMYRSNILNNPSNPQSPHPPPTPNYPQSSVRSSPHASIHTTSSQLHGQPQSAYPLSTSTTTLPPSAGVDYHYPPYTAVHSSGNFHGNEASEMMPSTVSMNRQALPPMMYSAAPVTSPSSLTSPSQDNRPMYQQSMGMPHAPASASYNYGYPSLGASSQSSYTHQPPLPQYNYQSQPMLGSQNSGYAGYPGQSTPQMQGLTSPRSGYGYAGMSKQGYRPQSSSGHQSDLPPNTPQSAQGSSTNASAPPSTAAPGPIPATTPMVVKQDSNGVQWISFEYSRDRVKHDYEIRCDVEHVDIRELTPEFKSENCVYPRACVPQSEYKGNRFTYESDCNAVGWALSSLNDQLRGKRGLIQRAVDSWRNSSGDQKLRSRRVRRQNKLKTRNNVAQQHQQQHSQQAAHHLLLNHPHMNMPLSHDLPSAPFKAEEPQLHHHHNAPTANGPAPLTSPADVKVENKWVKPETYGGSHPSAVDATSLTELGRAPQPRVSQQQTHDPSGLATPADSRPRSLFNDFNTGYPSGTVAQQGIPLSHGDEDPLDPSQLSNSVATPRRMYSSPKEFRRRKVSRSDDLLEDPRRRAMLQMTSSLL